MGIDKIWPEFFKNLLINTSYSKYHIGIEFLTLLFKQIFLHGSWPT